MKNFAVKIKVFFRPAVLILSSFIILFWFTASPTESVDESSKELRFTVVKGRVLDAVAASEGSEIPIVGAEVYVFGTKGSAITDSNGYFEIRRVPLERGMVINIDSSEAYPAPDGSIYAGFRMFFALKKLHVNNFERPFYLTRLDPESITTIDPLETTIVESPSMGVTLKIKPGTAYTDDGELYDGIIGLGLVPGDFPPYIPPDDPGMFLMVTIQPPGINFSEPAEITYPNLDGFSPGSDLSILQPSLATGNFETVGIGKVSDDGSYIETTSGGIMRSGSCNGPRPPNPVGGPPVQDPPPCPDCCPLPIGSCTSLASGNLSEEHDLVSYKSLNEDRSLKFVYNSTLADPRPTIKEITDLSNIAPETPASLSSMSIKVSGVDKGNIYTNVQGLAGDKKIVQALQFDAGNLTSGIYPLDATITAHYSSGITKPIIKTGDLIINNLKNSEYGSGWGIEGVSRLFHETDGDVVITEGNGDWKYFKLRATTLNPPIAPGSTAGVALNFDGLIDRNSFVVGSSNLLKTVPLTIEVWVRPRQRYEDPSVHSHVFGNIGVSSGGGVVLERGHGIGVNVYNNNSNIVITRRHGNSDTGPNNFLAREIITSPKLEPGFWYHVAVVYTTGNHKVYLNGELINDSSYPQGLVTVGNNVLNMGRIQHCCIIDPHSPQYYKGDIDEVRVWNIARTQQEIQSAMSTQLSGSESGLVYYSKIDEGQGQSIADATGTGNTGTLGHNASVTTNDPVWITYDPYNRDTQGDYVIPVTEHSLLFKNPDGTYTRKLKNGDEVHFNALGLQTSVVEKNGNTTNYEYDGQGKLISITDPVGLVTTVTYSGEKIASVTDPAGRITNFETDGSGNLTKITDPDGSFRLFSYDSNHRLTSQTSKRGFVTTYQYNFAGKNIGAIRPDGSTVSMSPQWMVGLVDPSTGLGTQSNPAPAVLPADVKATSTDGNGKTTTTIFNNSGFIVDTTDPLARRTIFTRNSGNSVTKITDPKGNITDNTYDSRRNLLTSINQAIGATTTFTYTNDGFNQIKTIKDPRNNTTTFNYNSTGDLTSIVDALSHQTTMAYNALGLQTSITDALNNTVSFDYDPATMNLVGTTDQLLQDTIFTLDAAGNVTSMTDAEGKTTTYSYDSMNRLTQVVDPDLAVTTYDYDDAGNLIAVTDAKSNMTTFYYDQRDRLNGRTDPLGHSESFTYDGNGNTVSMTNRNGQTITYEYNGANELINKTLPGSLLTTYTYDNNGNMLTANDPDSKLTMTYDGADRMLTISTAGSSNQPSKTITNTYDLSGNRTGAALSTPAAGNFTFVYDALNRRTSMTEPGTKTFNFSYDAIGRRTQLVYGNGAIADYTYDAKSQLTSLTNNFNGNVISSFSYGYDNVGNRTIMNTVRSGITVNSPLNYIYDNLYRLVEATNPINTIPESFIYDSVGNRLRKTGQATDSQFDDANALIEDVDYTYTYDNNGNMIEKVNKTTLEVTQYIYDAENRLIQVTKPGTTAAYRYDALSRRIEKTVNGTATRFIYDGQDLLEEFNASNTYQARYIHGPGVDEPMLQGRTIRHYYHTDGLGSTTELVSSGGSLQNSYVYDSFGNIASQAGTEINPFTYTGREYDAESGLYYYRARYYDPTIGRFLSEDPIGFAGGINKYVYVGNSPITLTDPYGLNPALACALNPACSTFVFEVCKAVVVGAAIAIGIIATSDICDDDDSDGDPDCGSDDGCDEEWERAFAICEKEVAKRRNRGITGGYTNIFDCARGLVSERCGGNAVVY